MDRSGEAIVFVLSPSPSGNFRTARHVMLVGLFHETDGYWLWKWRQVSQLMFHNYYKYFDIAFAFQVPFSGLGIDPELA